MSAVSKSVVQLGGGGQSPALGLGPGGGGVGQSLLALGGNGGGGGGQLGMSYLGLIPHPTERIDRGATWSDPEVDELLNIWTNENVQAELKEATIKKHIFERIARNLREKGFFRTAEQCREKIKRLKKEYRQAKNNNYRCVRGRATVKFFPRLQAVLDHHSIEVLRPSLKSYYDSPGDFGHADSPSPANHNHTFALSIKASPHSYSDCSAEEIKVDVNPAEVDNDVYMGGGSDAGGPGDPDADDGPSPSGGGGSDCGHPQPHPAHYNNNNSGGHNHQPHHHRGARPPSPPAPPQRPQPAHHSRPPNYNHHHHHPTLMQHPMAPLHQPISISIPLAHNHHHHNSIGLSNNSRHSNHSAPSGHSLNNNNNNGGNGIPMLRPLASSAATDDPECVSEASSACSRVSTPAPLSPPARGRSPPSSSPTHHSASRKKKLKRGRSFRSHALRETLDETLDRFLRHQRESEERLFAWEERRVQMELEAEERWRLDDRTMLRQIMAQFSAVQPTNGTSEPSPVASSGSRSNSSHEH